LSRDLRFHFIAVLLLEVGSKKPQPSGHAIDLRGRAALAGAHAAIDLRGAVQFDNPISPHPCV